MLHLIDVCFLTCICLWQILQIQTCFRVVVGSELVSTSPAFMRSIASHPAGPHGRLAQNMVIGSPLLGVCHTTVTDPPHVGCVFWRNNVVTVYSTYLSLSKLCNGHTSNGLPRAPNHLVCHVSSMGRALSFRTAGTVFEPRHGLTRHIQCFVGYNVYIR